jgi:transposase-like protein
VIKSEQSKEIYRYSLAFKQKVVKEIEEGKYGKDEARKIYDIRGTYTIQTWIKKLGKLYLLNKVIRIEMKDEVSRLKQLEKEKKELESALAQAHLKLLAYETLIEVAEENLGIELKKNLKLPPSQAQNRKARRAGKK